MQSKKKRLRWRTNLLSQNDKAIAVTSTRPVAPKIRADRIRTEQRGNMPKPIISCGGATYKVTFAHTKVTKNSVTLSWLISKKIVDEVVKVPENRPMLELVAAARKVGWLSITCNSHDKQRSVKVQKSPIWRNFSTRRRHDVKREILERQYKRHLEICFDFQILLVYWRYSFFRVDTRMALCWYGDF